MNLSVEIRWLEFVKSSRGRFTPGDCLSVSVDCDYVEDHDDLISAIIDDIGKYDEGVDFELVNEEQFWNDMDCPASEITNPQALMEEDPRIEKIRNVLRRHFDVDDDGNVSKTFDEDYTAQAAIDDIHSIIGNI